jgi:hypothetical protein
MALDRLIKKVRSLAVDDYAPNSATYEYTSDVTFTLPSASVQASSVAVYVNNVLVVNVSGDIKYVFDSVASTVTFQYTSGILVAGDVLAIHFNEYSQWTDNEVKQYIQAAIIRLSTEKYTTFVLRDDETIFPTPVEQDENLIALVASILMEGNLSEYRTNEVQIVYAKDEDNESRIKRTIRQFKHTFGVLDYHNLRRPYTLYVEDSDMTLENLP